MMKQWLAVAVLMALLAGCSSTPEEEETLPPEILYRRGVQAVQKKRFPVAVKRFQEVDRKHPFSPWAVRAQLNLIYAHYMDEEYEEAISAAERFVRLHPRHPHVAYPYYMLALAHYKRIGDPLRDQGHTRQAEVAFRELINRFPDSDYAEEARRMLDLCRDRLAAQEVVVGRFYLDRDHYIAAANRFRRVVENQDFNRTPYVEEALFGLVMSSLKLGLPEEALTYAAVLGHNYANGPFYPHARAMVEGQGTISKSDLKTLRKAVDETSLFKQFFEGVAPGVPGLTDR
ncbi:MAG: outer membrane protein assembly factor BamD [Magnetococcales bacterium]|nr:outer membrane protein assembly factor BamD [Magnetococcales bacterium]